MKIETRDIIFMVWGYFGSCLIGTLILLADLRYITGKAVDISDYILNGILILGGLFVLFLIIMAVLRRVLCVQRVSIY